MGVWAWLQNIDYTHMNSKKLIEFQFALAETKELQ